MKKKSSSSFSLSLSLVFYILLEIFKIDPIAFLIKLLILEIINNNYTTY